MAKLMKFGKRYSMMINEASNEEVVSISKELSGELVDKVKTSANQAVAVTLASAFLMLVMVTVSSGMTIPDAYSTPFLFARLAAVMLVCVGTIVGFLAYTRFQRAGSYSTLMWRNIRESANDDKVYEQRAAVQQTTRTMGMGLSNMTSAIGLDVAGVVVLVVSYAVQLFIENGFI